MGRDFVGVANVHYREKRTLLLATQNDGQWRQTDIDDRRTDVRNAPESRRSRWSREQPFLTCSGRATNSFTRFLACQKSGFTACGTSASRPGYHWLFSAQGRSTQPSGSFRYVMVAVHGIVKAPLSSTVKRSCRYLP